MADDYDHEKQVAFWESFVGKRVRIRHGIHHKWETCDIFGYKFCDCCLTHYFHSVSCEPPHFHEFSHHAVEQVPFTPVEIQLVGSISEQHNVRYPEYRDPKHAYYNDARS